jgi:ABC-type transport system involved in multi-copper enzyme maturation permease subunit
MADVSLSKRTPATKRRARLWFPWPEAVIGTVLLLIVYIDLFLPWHIWPYAVALLAATCLVSVVRLIRHHRFYVVGPLFFYDVVRLARRGRSTLLRVVFALCLLAGLCIVYDARFPQQKILRNPFSPGPTMLPQEVGNFANVFVGVLLAVQALAVLVLTPAYLAGAIAEEKEKRTLELLFTTHLTDREIVLGKLFARMLHLAGVLLVSLPVLAILQLWGGANPFVIVAAFAASLFSLLSIGSVSILCSVLARNVLNALLFTYAVVLLVSFCCLGVPNLYVTSPLSFTAALAEQVGGGGLEQLFFTPRFGSPARWGAGMVGGQLAIMVATYGFCHGLIAAFCLSLAVALVRSAALGQAENAQLRPPPAERPRVPVRVTGGWGEPPISVARPALPVVRPVGNKAEPAFIPRRPRGRALPGRHLPAVSMAAHPLLWKEVYHRTTGSEIAIACIVAGIILPPIMFMIYVAQQMKGLSYYEFARDSLNPVIRGACLVIGGLWVASVAFLAGRSITQEREQQTLEGLLMLPVEREKILGAKWLGSILRGRYLAYLLAVYLVLGLLSGAIHPLGALLMALAIVIDIAFLASLGVCLSLVSRTTLWANFTMALMLLLVFVGSWVVLVYTTVLSGSRPVKEQRWWYTFSEFGLNPPRTWWHLGFTWDQFGSEIDFGRELWRGGYGACLAGMLTFAVATWVFWWAAKKRFRQE